MVPPESEEDKKLCQAYCRGETAKAQDSYDDGNEVEIEWIAREGEVATQNNGDEAVMPMQLPDLMEMFQNSNM